MGKPKNVYYVSQSGAKLRYGQRGGGLFSTLSGALGRAMTMRQNGGQATIYRSKVEWEELDEETTAGSDS